VKKQLDWPVAMQNVEEQRGVSIASEPDSMMFR